MSNAVDRLLNRARELLSGARGIRRNVIDPVFKRVALITPSDVNVVNYPRRPVEVFNPAAVLNGDELLIFPRIIFDYLNYVSSIGLIRLRVSDLINGVLTKPIEARLIMWPRELWEFRGCEDPRVIKYGDGYLMLYTGWGYYLTGDGLKPRAHQALAVLNSGFEVTGRGFFRIRTINNDYYTPDFWKDSAFIRVNGDSALMLTRPNINGIEVGWVGYADLRDLTVSEDSMKPILPFEDFEFKVGWSTNAVELSKGEYLVGWHGVVKDDYSYRNGLAVINDDGELIAISNYLLAPGGLVEEYGDRPRVVFGDGLVKYGEWLMWVGGVSDYAVGVYLTNINKALNSIKYIRKS
ncbi:MAG: glycosidase [Caldivirga sp.]|uniref:glycoside hydrolase family 130 protein n=1 Tax=Caldivirga sp. TaxID=2080243 RepID=UPI003D0FDE1F